MSGGPLEVVHAHLDAFNTRDLDAVLAGFAEDAVFATGEHLIVGRRGIRALFADAFAVPTGVSLEIRRAVVDGDTVACELVERIAGHELDVAAFYTARGGELVRVKVYREGTADWPVPPDGGA